MRALRTILAAAAAAFCLAAPPVHAGTFGSETITAPIFTDPTLGTTKNATGVLSATSNTVLANIPGMAITLTTGNAYYCFGHIYVAASGASGGINLAAVSDGTLAVSSFRSFGHLWNGTTLAGAGTGGALGTIANVTAVVTEIDFNFTTVVTTTGSLLMQAAQNASNATTTTVAGAGTAITCLKSG